MEKCEYCASSDCEVMYDDYCEHCDCDHACCVFCCDDDSVNVCLHFVLSLALALAAVFDHSLHIQFLFHSYSECSNAALVAAAFDVLGTHLIVLSFEVLLLLN